MQTSGFPPLTFHLSVFTLFKFHHRNSCTAELYMLVVEMLHKRHGAQVLAHECAQYAIACSVKDAQAVNKNTTVVIFGRKVMGWCYMLAGVAAMAVMTPVWMEMHLWSLAIISVYLALHIKNWLYLKKAQGAALNPLLGKTAVTLLVFSLLFLIATTAN